MLLRIDPDSNEPLFVQLTASIRSAVASGELVAGERLPAARQLAESLDVNVHTVLRAYQILRDDGLLDLRRGRGAVISTTARDFGALHEAMHRVVREAARLGLSADATTSLMRTALTGTALTRQPTP